MKNPIERRNFLFGAGAGVAAVAIPARPAAASEPAPVAPPASAAANAAAPIDVYQCLGPAEAAFVAAVADTMIPADDLSPSGSDCGVVVYIDRQLGGAFGAGDRSYRSGPFLSGDVGQGPQSPLCPLAFFRAGVVAADRWCVMTHGHAFDRLAPADRATALTAMETGKAEFSGLSAKSFFTLLLQLVMEGFFSDPVYGGNRDKISWRMIGYPGLPATYHDKIEIYRGKRYQQEPQSIADFS